LKGGNLLLNVGPTARGEFDPRAQETLRKIGEWTRVHGRSIYGCTQSDYTAPSDCRFTQNGNRLYCHILSWPPFALHLDGLAGKVKYAQLLNDASEIQIARGAIGHGAGSTDAGNDTLTLRLPIQKPNVAVPVIERFLSD
jgi:alpha-L-fucosidase